MPKDQGLTIREVKFQGSLSLLACKSYAKTLFEKKQDPDIWNREIWFNVLKNIVTPDSSESFS